METKKCCICGKEIHENEGHNPYPLILRNDYDSECCDECNAEYVLKMRINQMSIDFDEQIEKPISEIEEFDNKVSSGDQTLELYGILSKGILAMLHSHMLGDYDNYLKAKNLLWNLANKNQKLLNNRITRDRFKKATLILVKGFLEPRIENAEEALEKEDFFKAYVCLNSLWSLDFAIANVPGCETDKVWMNFVEKREQLKEELAEKTPEEYRNYLIPFIQKRGEDIEKYAGEN